MKTKDTKLEKEEVNHQAKKKRERKEEYRNRR